MRKVLLTLISFLLISTPALAKNGQISIKSPHSVKITADKLERILNDRGMTLFTRIDHAAGAKKVGKDLRATELLIFGNPEVGAPIMQCSQTAAIDLPQKALIWEDEKGQVWFTYNSPGYLKDRHAISDCDEMLGKVEKALALFARSATAP